MYGKYENIERFLAHFLICETNALLYVCVSAKKNFMCFLEMWGTEERHVEGHLGGK